MLIRLGDITTTSTSVMLRGIQEASLNDGWSGSGAAGFEFYTARFAGHEVAIFMVSSSMSNQVAVRAHLARPRSGVICDARSHIVHMEVGGIASMFAVLPRTLLPINGLYLSVEDIKRKIVLSNGSDACTCPTWLIHREVLEVGLSCRSANSAESNALLRIMTSRFTWMARDSGRRLQPGLAACRILSLRLTA